MKNIVILVSLGLLTMVGAVIELFFQNLPSSLVQINGLLTIVFAMLFVIWTLRLQATGLHHPEQKSMG